MTAALFLLLTLTGAGLTLYLPAAAPGWVGRGALAGAAGVWLAAQWLVQKRIRIAYGPDAAPELALLRERSADALATGRLDEARQWLDVALAVRDDDPLVWRERAVVLTRTGDLESARRAWRHTHRLSNDPDLRDEASEAMAALTGR